MSKSLDLGEGIIESFDPALRRAFEVSDEVPQELKDYSKVKIRKDSILMSGDAFFYTLQGEGPTMGLPCVFVRLHMCNLACTWCDAFYTWSPDSTEFWTESTRYTFKEAANQIDSAWEGPDNVQHRAVFTGGEPLIQKTQIDRVMTLLDPNYDSEDWLPKTWKLEIETNGTLMPTPAQLRRAQFNCSPKLANSHNREGSMVKPKILKALNNACTTFKFVSMDESDLDEIEKLYLPHIDHDKVIIMPQGILEEEVSMNAKKLAEPCKDRGFRLMPRLQNICWDGARRGV